MRASKAVTNHGISGEGRSGLRVTLTQAPGRPGRQTRKGTAVSHQDDTLILEDDAIPLIKDKKVVAKSSFQPIIRIPEEIFIPDEFINDLDIKMSVYKRISLITNNQERNNLMTELVDRFGKLPNEVENLFKLIEIKILCIKNNIEQIEFGRKGILFSFALTLETAYSAKSLLSSKISIDSSNCSAFKRRSPIWGSRSANL